MNANHLGRFQFALSLIASNALKMVLGPRGEVKAQVRGVVILLAVQALSPVRVSASIPRPLSTFEQEVVGPIRAHDQVLRAVVGPLVIDVVDFLSALQVPSEGAFGYENVLEDVPVIVGVGMSRRTLQNISVAVSDYSALPVRVALKLHPHRMPFANQQRVTLANTAASAVPSAFRNRSGKPAPTLTKARRIYHNGAPNEGAGCTYQSNIFRGYSLA